MPTRREFTISLGGAAVLATVKSASGGSAGVVDEPQVPAAAARLYRKAFVLDCNTIASIGYQLDGPEAMKLVRESGVTALKSTLGGATGSFEDAVADIAAAERLIDTTPGVFLKVRTAADLGRAQEQRKVGVIYSFEASSPLEDKVDRIEMFRNLGVRVMQLSYNRRSPFGVGCLDGDTEGVTDLGRQAIAKMNELGVALDLSHANTQTTADGIALSKKPPIVTHAGCRAVFVHPRNKEDREMKALADKGGVMGIYMLPYLTPSPKQPMLDDYVQHMEHALKVCGEDHVGVGTDVPFLRVEPTDLENMKKAAEERKKLGIAAPGEDRPTYIPDANTPRKMQLITAALLKRGHSSGVVEKVLGANFRRVFGEIWLG